MKKNELIGKLQNSQFGSSVNLNEAFNYALHACEHEFTYADRVSALHVLLNTICRELENLEEEKEKPKCTFTLQGYVDGDLQLFGLFDTEADAVERMHMEGYDKYGYYDANKWIITEWQGTKIVSEYEYVASVSFKKTEK